MTRTKSAKNRRKQIDYPARDQSSHRYPQSSDRPPLNPGPGPNCQSPAGPPRKRQRTDAGTASQNFSNAQLGSGAPSHPQQTQNKSAQKKGRNQNVSSKKKARVQPCKRSPHPPVVRVVKKTFHKNADKRTQRLQAEAMQKTSSQHQSSQGHREEWPSSKSSETKSNTSKQAEGRPNAATTRVGQNDGGQVSQINQAHSRPDGKQAQSSSLKAKSESLAGQSTSTPKMAKCVVSGANSKVASDGQVSRRYEYIPINLRPITRLWALEHLKGLTGSNPQEPYGWFNVRVLSGEGMGVASPEDVVKMFQSHKIFLTDLITLDLGWPRGEWMVRIIGQDRLRQLSEKDCFAEGVLVHGGKSEGGLDYLISRLPTPEELQADAPQFPVPVVLMGIPYYFNPALELDRYLYESITAQNKAFGIEAIAVQQRYQIGPTRTNDVRCHVMLDSKALYRWEFNRSMRLNVQGWDSAGVPRPEIWSVSMRHIDECAVCGGYYHQSDNSAELKPCEVSERLERLSRVLATSGNSVNGSAADPGSGLLDLDRNFSAERIEAVARGKTSIGFFVA